MTVHLFSFKVIRDGWGKLLFLSPLEGHPVCETCHGANLTTVHSRIFGCEGCHGTPEKIHLKLTGAAELVAEGK